MYQIVNNYRDNNELRYSFNKLAKKTFGLDFEDWYQNGFWWDSYNPYSVVEDGKVVANVSVNKTDLFLSGLRSGKCHRNTGIYGNAEGDIAAGSGSIKHLLQLGTVMTEETYRNRGLIRMLMEQIDKDYGGQADGVYLFANDSVLEFYPKFGFRLCREYQYSKELSNSGACLFEKIRMDNPQAWERLLAAMEHSVFRSRFFMVGNRGLIMFYVTKFMQDCVYYHKDSDTYIIADLDGQNIMIHNIFSGTLQTLDDVTALLGKEIRTATLGFVPMETDGCTAVDYHEEDCTFFVKGSGMDIFCKERLRIPSLSHA